MGEGRSRSFYVLAAFFTAYVLFLYGPMFAIYVLSFQGPDGGLTFPMNGVSLVWFSKVPGGMGAMRAWYQSIAMHRSCVAVSCPVPEVTKRA